MSDPKPSTSPLDLGALPVRRGHFLLESGLHAERWIDLDALFLEPAALAPQVAALSEEIRTYGVTAICGPLLGGALLAQQVALHLGLRFYLTRALDPSAAEAIYGAVYRLPPALRLCAGAETFAVVDDVISAGSSVRATVAELTEAGARTAVVGSLLALGTRAVDHFAAAGMPLVTLSRQELVTWLPGDCPHCRAGVPLERPG